MNADKLIKIGIDPTNVWDNNFFREYVKTIINDVDNYDVYIVTDNQDVDFLANVESESNIDPTKVNQVSNNSAVIARLNTLNISIYLSENNVLVDLVNNVLSIQLNSNNVTGCQALVLNNVFDTYLTQQKWITKIDFWQKQILKQYA